MSTQLIHGDCRVEMAKMADGSVDLIVTDPPYYSTNLAFDKAPRIDYKQWLIDYKRVLKDTGVLVSFCDLNLLIELKGNKVFKTAYEIVWQKNISVGFLDANRRPLRNHEFIIVMTNALNKSTYNPQKTKGKPFYKKENPNTPNTRIYGKSNYIDRINESGDRHPSTVLNIKHDSERCNSKITNKVRHPTQKPLELCEWLVKTYSNNGDTLLDCFTGSGSTGVAAQNLNRNFIGIELDSDYFEMAKNRIEGAQGKEVEAA